MEDSPKTATYTKTQPANDTHFYREHARILQLLVAGAPLPEILSPIAILIESLCPTEAWCAISVLNPGRSSTEFTTAPSIPEDFSKALADLHAPDTEGTCGKAISTGRTVIVENVMEDPEFEIFRGLSLRSGIFASTSLPVFGNDNNVIAVITNFYHGTHRPGDREIQRTEDLRNLVSLAIEKTSAARELADSNSRFQSIAASTNDAVWDWDIASDTIWWSDLFHTLFGFKGAGNGPSVEEWLQRIHSEDRDRVYNSLARVLASGQNLWTEEYRFFRNDGSIAYVLDKATVSRDESGRALRMVGGMRDMTSYTAAKQELTSLNRALEMLRSCNQILIRATDERQILTDVCRIAAEIGGYRLAWVGYAQGGKEKLITPEAHYGEGSGYLKKIKLSHSEDHPTGDGPAGRTIRSGKPFVCTDVRKESDFFWRLSAIEQGLLSVVCLPLKNADGCFGFLALLSGEVKDMGEDELALLTELAENLAFGISSIRNRVREKTLRDAIFKLAGSATDSVDNSLYETLALDMTRTLGASSVIIGRISQDNETVNSLSYVLDGKVKGKISYSLADTPCEQVGTGEVCIWGNRIREKFPEDHAILEGEAESYACIALLDKNNRRSGVISVIFKQRIKDTTLVTSILKIFGERAAAEMERQNAETLLVEQASLLDKARDAILTFGIDHHITFLNRSAEDLYGYSFLGSSRPIHPPPPPRGYHGLRYRLQPHARTR